MSSDRAAGPHQEPRPATIPTDVVAPASPATVLTRNLPLSLGGGLSLITIGAFVTAIVLRTVRLDTYVLGDDEARRAYEAWSLFQGRPLPGTEQIPDTAPFFLLVEALSFFLFGVTDAIARLAPALFGVGIIGLLFALRPFVSRLTLLGTILVTAVSPTLVYGSRTIDPAIAVAFSSLLTVISLLRAANSGSAVDSARWMMLAGAGMAATLAGGPEGVNGLIAIASALFVTLVTGSSGTAGAHQANGHNWWSARSQAAFAMAFVFTLVALFTRMFSDISALEGILTTFGDWARIMASRSTPLPQSFFFYAVLLYEILALVFALFAMVTATKPGPGQRKEATQLIPVFFAVWFLVSLVLHSFASGREPEQAVLVALPLTLLGGMGLGRLFENIRWNEFFTSRAGMFPVALLCLFIGAIAIVMVIARANDRQAVQSNGWPELLQIVFVLVVVVLPVTYFIWSRTSDRSATRDLGYSALLVVALLLGFFTVRSASALSFYRADDGTELLARNIPTQGVRAFVDQTYRLSRDLSVENMSNIDNTGSFGLHIAVAPEVEWPFLWYFRDFPNVRVAGPAGWTEDDDIVIAQASDGMDAAGFVIDQKAFKNRTPNAHIDLNAGTIFRNLFSPGEWYNGLRYVVFREMQSKQPPSTVSVGYAFRVSNQINPNLGPFDLFTPDDPGPGIGLGQLSSPTGIAVSPDGQIIYVVNAGNQRIERYASDGTFVGVWDASTDPGLSLAFQNGQGASDITIGDDGLIYVSDTWNHIVLVIDQEGRVVRQLGQRGVLTDIGDGGDPLSETGLFFGPRGLAVLEDEIYVADTGNERIQVFSKDGTFLRTFGGFGTGGGQLQEPTDIAAGPDGYLYVADSGNGRLVVFSPQGEVVRELPVASWVDQMGVDRLNYLAFSGDGVLYMTSPSRGVLEAYDGSQVMALEDDDLVRPMGVAVAPEGTVLVTDGAGSSVVRIEPQLQSPDSASPQASPDVGSPEPAVG